MAVVQGLQHANAHMEGAWASLPHMRVGVVLVLVVVVLVAVRLGVEVLVVVLLVVVVLALALGVLFVGSLLALLSD